MPHLPDFLRADFQEPKPRVHEQRGWTVHPCGHVEIDYRITQRHACYDLACHPWIKKRTVTYGILTFSERRN